MTMKKLLFLFLLLTLPVALSAQLKVGVMDPDLVLDSLPEAAQVQSELENFIQQRQTTFQNRYQNWLAEVTAYAEAVEAGSLSESDQQNEEIRLTEIQEELNNLQMLIERQIQNRQNELFSPLLQRVENAMAEVSAELGLDFVINKTSNTGDPIVYYSSRRAPDITERVIQYLTQN
ncbi:MAG: OmpH family outer membrane protein [Balneolaceae bacterium]|nr:MAG: OmpH family outer membrane protein [Balneolaceae bacterium]